MRKWWVLLCILFIFASEGPRDGATFASDGTNIGIVVWSVPSRAQTSNNSYAVASGMTAGDNSEYLMATNFSFASVTGTIDGIVVEIEKKTSLSSTMTDEEVKLVKGGTVQGNNKASGTTWGTSDAYSTYGTSTDKWGLTWTASDITASTFGCVISCVASGSANASVDHIRITVYYTEASGTKRYLIGMSKSIEVVDE